jgi:hypothetical protein
VSWLLELIRTLWPVAVVVMPLVTGAGFLWLKTQFPTKSDFDAIQERLADGSRKLAALDKRLALVEDDCDSSPSKQDLNQNYAVLAGRMSGVESSLKGLEKALSTQNDYVHALIQKGLSG